MDSVQEFISNCFDYAGIHNIPALISTHGHILGIPPDTSKSSSFPLLWYKSSTGLLCRLKPKKRKNPCISWKVDSNSLDQILFQLPFCSHGD
ncbi:unnamed protein product, partial [Sphagnum jensenii]